MRRSGKSMMVKIFGLWLATLLLGGCFVPFSRGPQYSDDEAKALCAKARTLAERTVELEGKIVSIEPYNPIDSHFLSEYAAGVYSDGDKQWKFVVNTETKEVYSNRHFPAYQAAAGEYLLNILGLGESGEVKKAQVTGITVPLSDNKRGLKSAVIPYLPIFVKDGRAFFAKRDKAQPITISCTAAVLDSFDLSALRLKDLRERSQQSPNLKFTLELQSGREEATVKNTSLSYRRWEHFAQDGMTIGWPVAAAEEIIDGNGNIKRQDSSQEKPDLLLEKTKDGYHFKVRNNDAKNEPKFRLIVADGSDIARGDIELWRDGKRVFTYYWKKLEYGEKNRLALCALGKVGLFYGEGDLIYAKK